MKIEHVAFNVKDPIALADWYVAHLGLTIVRKGDAPINIRFLADDEGRTLLEVYSNPLGNYVSYGDMHPVTFHIALTVEDMEATQQRLVDAGGTIDGEIEHTPAGDRLAFVRDPWGNAIQLVQRKTPLV